MKNFIITMMTFTLVSCANYRTNTKIEFNSTKVPDHDKSILILESDIKDKEYTKISNIEAVVKKLTAFHSRPTNEQANYVLRHLAKEKRQML